MPRAASRGWGCCDSKPDDGEPRVDCSICRTSYHSNCLNDGQKRTLDRIDSISWVCPLCVINKKPKKGNNDNTPIRNVDSLVPTDLNVTKRSNKRFALSTSPESCSMTVRSPLSHDEVHAIVSEVMQTERMNLMSELKRYFTGLIQSQLKPVMDEIREVKDSIEFMNAKYEDVLKELKDNTTSVGVLKEENIKTQSTVKELNGRINYLEQQARSCNVELQCIPEKDNENIKSIVTQLGSLVGCKNSDETIVHCTRVAKANRTNPRPRSIVVQFSSPRTRDDFLANSIKFNKRGDRLNSSHLGISGDKQPIFVVEHLSPANKYLHAAARKRARELEFKYVWVRNGKIYMRKNDTSDYKIIKDIDYLNSLS